MISALRIADDLSTVATTHRSPDAVIDCVADHADGSVKQQGMHDSGVVAAREHGCVGRIGDDSGGG